MNPRRFSFIYMLLAFFSLVIGFALGFIVDPMMFARMGSLTVLFGVMSEYSLLKFKLSNLYQKLESSVNTNKSPTIWHQKKGYVSHVLVVAGTITWGFGDLVIISLVSLINA